MADPFVLYVGDLSPAITDTILVDGVAPVGMVSARFQTRRADSPDAGWVIDAAATTFNATTGAITYAWQPGDSDVDQVGLYAARWLITLSGSITQTKDAGYVRIVEFGEETDPTLLDLCTLADVRQAIEVEGTDRDALIETCITAASVAIARRYQRQFGVIGVKTFTFEATGTLIDLAPCDLQDTADLLITLDPGGDDELVLDPATDFKLRPARAASGTYYRIRLNSGLSLPPVSGFGFYDVEITAAWGFPAIDPDVRRACVITASAWLDRAVTTYEMPDVGQVGMNYVPARASTWAIPGAAHTLLSSFERMVVG